MSGTDYSNLALAKWLCLAGLFLGKATINHYANEPLMETSINCCLGPSAHFATMRYENKSRSTAKESFSLSRVKAVLGTKNVYG